MLDGLKSGLGSGFRSFRRMPFLVAGAVLTLAVSTGLNVAVLGLVDRALLSPPQGVSEPGRVFTLGFNRPGDDPSRGAMSSTSYVAFRALRDAARGFSGAAAFRRSATTLMLDGDQRSVNAMFVSGGYFDLLGARAALGRALDPADDREGAVPTAVLSYDFWRVALREDASAVGRRIVVGGLEYTVVGVMAQGFTGHAATSVDLYVPFAAAMRNTPGWDLEAFRNVAGVVVSLAPSANESAAATQAGSVVERSVSLHPIAGSGVGPTERSVATWLCALAVLVFLIGLANSATLLVVRGVKTRPAAIIRAALGASRARLRAQALGEALLLALMVTAISLVLASWMEAAIRPVLFPDLAAFGATSMTQGTIAVLAGLLAMIVASVSASSQIPAEGHGMRPGAADPGRRRRSLTALLLAQTSLAVLLLAGAGLFGASLHRLRAQDFGLEMEGAMVVDFDPTSGDIAGQDRLFADALERITTIPGVQIATPIDSAPFAGFNVPPISVPGHATPPSVGEQLPFLTAATPQFLRILGIKVVEGRPFEDADEHGAPVVLINQTMARAVWPGESAIGKCIRIGFDPDFDPQSFDPSGGPPMPSPAVPCREVVGVTRDVRQRSVLPTDGEDRLMQYFVPFSQAPVPPFAPPEATRIRGILLRAQNPDGRLAAAIRRLVLGDRTDLPFLRVRNYSELLERQMRPWDMGTRLLALFSTLALAVAATGMFASFAHAVAERKREMAIRLAIGARPRAVLGMVIREALWIAGGGVLLGWAGALFAGRSLRSLLFGTEPSDPLVLVLISVSMLVVAALATLIPAREAAKADPSVLLRAE